MSRSSSTTRIVATRPILTDPAIRAGAPRDLARRESPRDLHIEHTVAPERSSRVGRCTDRAPRARRGARIEENIMRRSSHRHRIAAAAGHRRRTRRGAQLGPGRPLAPGPRAPRSRGPPADPPRYAPAPAPRARRAGYGMRNGTGSTPATGPG